MNITQDVVYVGVNDHITDLFESQYKIENGVSYNSYLIKDACRAVVDSVEEKFGEEWLSNIERELSGAAVDYLIVQHMEPDHSSSITRFISKYPNAKIVASKKAFEMMKNFYGCELSEASVTVGEGSVLSLGRHSLRFITAPMVHWPEVIMTYDETDKLLFSADAFGKFGSLDYNDDWIDEARRYYIGIVGKYGTQVQAVLKKAAALDIEAICPLHGPVLNKNLSYYLGLYHTWSSHAPEEEGVVIAYSSIYGNTARAARRLLELISKKMPAVLYDLARCDQFAATADAFRYSRLVLASATYNNDVFPPMREFIHKLCERGYRGRRVGIIENGSWAPAAAKVMRGMLEGCRDLSFAENEVRILSAPNAETDSALIRLAEEITA
jgi:flavorubredoxin